MEDDRLTQEQINAVKDALVNFVTRVSARKDNTYDAETAVLPDVANVLLSTFL